MPSGCVDRMVDKISISSLTDVSEKVIFSVFAILTCCVIESPITMVSIPFCVQVSIVSVVLTLVVGFGFLLIIWLALG